MSHILLLSLALGLGVMKLVDLLEAVIPWPQSGGMKILYTLALSLAGAGWMASSWQNFALISSATLGLSSLGHGAEVALLGLRDLCKLQVIRGMKRSEGGRGGLF